MFIDESYRVSGYTGVPLDSITQPHRDVERKLRREAIATVTASHFNIGIADTSYR